MTVYGIFIVKQFQAVTRVVFSVGVERRRGITLSIFRGRGESFIIFRGRGM